MFNISTRPPFTEWFNGLDENDKIEVRAYLEVLKSEGPNLGRPRVDSLYDSKYSNMKELRVQSKGKPLRVFFAFDPQRTGIILCGGDKTGVNEKRFYKQHIKIADEEFGKHLKGE